MKLRSNFDDREDLVNYCREIFVESLSFGNEVSDTVGGIDQATELLEKADPVSYGNTRNSYKGSVTKLSPYLRHGVLGLTETSQRVKSKAGNPQKAYKLLQELAWRDYWRRYLDQIGDSIWDDIEPYKTGFLAGDYESELPSDFLSATTGNDFVDGTVNELHETGYLHNQGRMKIASYLVHWRRVRWQAGARWMLSHLLDGDLASNNLSWQWVASTFSAKPYIFNQENLIKVTDGKYTGTDADGSSPFSGSYDELNERLFR